MRNVRTMAIFAALIAALFLAACEQSLGLKENLETKVAYVNATYALTLVSGNSSGGTVNLGTATVHNEERIGIAATPSAGWLFAGWTVSPAGAATVEDPYRESSSAFVVGADATIQANFTAPKTRNWSAIASSSTGQYLAATVNLYMVSSTEPSVYTSSNYGATWTMRRNSPPGMTFVSIASDSTGRYLAAAASQGGTIYTSSDFGATWVQRSSGLPTLPTVPPTPGADWSSIASDGSGANLIAAVSGGSVYRSIDYGATWTEHAGTDLPAGAYWSKVSSNEDGTRLTASIEAGEAYYSLNGGAAWNAMQNLPAGGSTLATQNSLGTRFVVTVAGTAAGGGAFTNDLTSGSIWNWTNFDTLLSYTSWSAVACDATGRYFIGAVSGGSLYTSDNFCNNTYSERNGSNGLPSSAGWSSVCSDASGARLAAAASNGHIYVSSDQGATWSLGL